MTNDLSDVSIERKKNVFLGMCSPRQKKAPKKAYSPYQINMYILYNKSQISFWKGLPSIERKKKCVLRYANAFLIY